MVGCCWKGLGLPDWLLSFALWYQKYSICVWYNARYIMGYGYSIYGNSLEFGVLIALFMQMGVSISSLLFFNLAC